MMRTKSSIVVSGLVYWQEFPWIGSRHYDPTKSQECTGSEDAALYVTHNSHIEEHQGIWMRNIRLAGGKLHLIINISGHQISGTKNCWKAWKECARRNNNLRRFPNWVLVIIPISMDQQGNILSRKLLEYVMWSACQFLYHADDANLSERENYNFKPKHLALVVFQRILMSFIAPLSNGLSLLKYWIV